MSDPDGAGFRLGRGCTPQVFGTFLALVVIVILGAIALGIFDSDEDDEPRTTARQESSVATPSDDDEASQHSAVRDSDDGLLDVYVLTFEPTSCADPNGHLDVPPAELRVGDTGTIEVWLPILRGSPDPRPFGELYLSGTTEIRPGGVFVYQIDPTIDAVSLDGNFRGSDVSGTYYLTITEDGQNVSDPCYRRRYAGTFDRTQPVG